MENQNEKSLVKVIDGRIMTSSLDVARGMTFVLPHGMNLLRIQDSEFYKWYCSTVMPSMPRLYGVYAERRNAIELTEGGGL